jgi:DNA ligase (NAD+)
MLGKFVHVVSRDCMNIEGLSEATLKKFIDARYIKDFIDIYNISDYKNKIINMDGLGKKSYDKLIKSIEKSKQIALPNFIKALGIEGVGKSIGKLICDHFNYDESKLFSDFNILENELLKIKGIGESIAKSYVSYMKTISARDIRLINIMQFEKPLVTTSDILVGKNFVITGSVNHFTNRNELKDKIESLGGKVTGSVTKNTNYLINNDNESNTKKNNDARSLGVQIINELEFMELIG